MAPGTVTATTPSGPSWEWLSRAEVLVLARERLKDTVDEQFLQGLDRGLLEQLMTAKGPQDGEGGSACGAAPREEPAEAQAQGATVATDAQAQKSKGARAAEEADELRERLATMEASMADMTATQYQIMESMQHLQSSAMEAIGRLEFVMRQEVQQLRAALLGSALEETVPPGLGPVEMEAWAAEQEGFVGGAGGGDTCRWHRFSAALAASSEIRRTQTWVTVDSPAASRQDLLEQARSALTTIVSASSSSSSSTMVVTKNPLTEDLHRAAEAYLAVRSFWRGLGSNSGNGITKSAKAAARAVRDTVAWRCAALVGVASCDAYLAALDDAFGGQLSRSDDLRSQMLNSYHHVLGSAPGAFHSKSSLNAQRHGRKRPRRREQDGQKGQEGSDGGALGMEMPVPVGTVDRGLEEAMGDPAFVPIMSTGADIGDMAMQLAAPWPETCGLQTTWPNLSPPVDQVSSELFLGRSRKGLSLESIHVDQDSNPMAENPWMWYSQHGGPRLGSAGGV